MFSRQTGTVRRSFAAGTNGLRGGLRRTAILCAAAGSVLALAALTGSSVAEARCPGYCPPETATPATVSPQSGDPAGGIASLRRAVTADMAGFFRSKDAEADQWIECLLREVAEYLEARAARFDHVRLDIDTEDVRWDGHRLTVNATLSAQLDNGEIYISSRRITVDARAVLSAAAVRGGLNAAAAIQEAPEGVVAVVAEGVADMIDQEMRPSLSLRRTQSSGTAPSAAADATAYSAAYESLGGIADDFHAVAGRPAAPDTTVVADAGISW